MTERTQWKHANKKRTPSCKYNPGVCCDTPYPAACAGCGWNPKVAERRLEAIKRTDDSEVSHRDGI